MRQKVYELFLYLHRSLALAALVGLFYHLKDAGDEYMPFIWPCVAFWAFDYTVRWARLLFLNYKVAIGGHVHALISYDGDHDVIQLTVFPCLHLAPKPGTYYFLYFPTLLRSFGAHPFTISGWTTASSHSEPMQVSLESEEKALEDLKSDAIRPVLANDVSSTSDTDVELHGRNLGLKFIIRPQKGLTASLRDRITKMESSTAKIPVLLEGPYGIAHPFEDYDTVLFIAGGTGISPVLGYLQSMLAQNRPSFQRRHVVWIGRSVSFFSYVLEDGLYAARADANTEIDLYLTGGGTLDYSSKFESQRVKLHRGRPHPLPLLETVITDNAQSTTTSVAVFVCGPGALADDTRNAVTTVLGGNYSVRLDYYEEQFGW